MTVGSPVHRCGLNARLWNTAACLELARYGLLHKSTLSMQRATVHGQIGPSIMPLPRVASCSMYMAAALRIPSWHQTSNNTCCAAAPPAGRMDHLAALVGPGQPTAHSITGHVSP